MSCCSDSVAVPAFDVDHPPMWEYRLPDGMGWIASGVYPLLFLGMFAEYEFRAVKVSGGGDCDGIGGGYTDTARVMRPIPPEKIAAARKLIDAIRAREKGLAGIEWPAGWIPSAVYPDHRIGPHGAARLPDTERGRRAAWELEAA